MYTMKMQDAYGNKNSFQHELAVEKNKLLSTKEEKDMALVLVNVRKMVEKYQGFMDVSEYKSDFHCKGNAVLINYVELMKERLYECLGRETTITFSKTNFCQFI